MAKRDQRQEMLDALRHPLRRSLLRRFLQSERMLSPKELAALESKSLSTLSYHVRVLLECDAIEVVAERPARGAVQHFYRPSPRLTQAPWVLASLGLES
jgi:DNA-binding transcriptional ArsR family regulator